MFETALKTALASALSRRLPAAVLIVLSQTIAWSPIAPTARAATDPESEPVSNPSATASTTSDASAATASNIASAYSAATGITGPTTPFHDSVASRYNYAFGKDAPFLPSNATSSNAFAGFIPSTTICPAVAGLSPHISFSTVDLPHPLGPMSVTKSPRSAEKLSWSRITGPSP